MTENCRRYLARRLATVVILGTLGATLASAQTRPRFAVASIKPSPRCLEDIGFHRSAPGRLMFPCISVRNLVFTAYGRFDGSLFSAKNLKIVGEPDWAKFDHYEVSARADGNTPIAAMAGPMLQSLLEERFGLKVHTEYLDTPVYALTVATGGPKIQPPPEGSCAPFDFDALVAARNNPESGAIRQCPAFKIMSGPPEEPKVADCHGLTIAEFARLVLGSFVDRPVIDRTGLKGRFDIRLEALDSSAPLSRAWMIANGVKLPPESQSSSAVPKADEIAAGPTVFEAVQKQLGLKLVPTRGPVEVLVIDSVERPTPN